MPRLVHAYWFIVHRIKSITNGQIKANHSGYTLIEVLIVVTIISVLTTLAYANYQKLKESQNLKGAAADIQSLVRQAQANAYSRVNCNGIPGADWSIIFNTPTQMSLVCQVSGSSGYTVKNLDLVNNIRLNSVTGTCQASYPVTITFASLITSVNFSDTTIPSCVSGSSVTSLTISLVNNNTGDIKNFKISKGGAIDAQ